MTNFTPSRSGEGGWGAARADLSWRIERRAGPAAELVALGLPTPPARLLRWCHPASAAVVLGSTQPPFPDALEAVRRPSGGSAVWLVPGSVAWADVVVPHGDPLWSDDVGVAPVWLGQAWAAAIAALGISGASVHTGAMIRTAWSDRVCFAGVAAGEVLVAGRKVVGISQRRTRAGALFQCATLLHWDPPVPELADVATGLGVTIDALEAALEANMP